MFSCFLLFGYSTGSILLVEREGGPEVTVTQLILQGPWVFGARWSYFPVPYFLNTVQAQGNINVPGLPLPRAVFTLG